MNTLLVLVADKCKEFPETYRTEEVTTILQWVASGESGVVVGVSGTGKSNLVGYLASRPDVTSQWLPDPMDGYCFLALDINSLPGVTTRNFYQVMLYKLQKVMESNPALNQAMMTILERLSSSDEPLTLYLAVQSAHQLLISHAGKQVIWLFDRFETACQQLEATTLNSLRSLRDQFKYHLSFIAFSRFPLAHLRNPAEYDEFHELMIMHTCWVGPLNWRDGQWSATQVMRRYRTTRPETALSLLFEECGGLAAFLKVAYSALASGELGMNDTVEGWREKVLTLPAFQRHCQEIWDDCTPEQQAILCSLALTGKTPKRNPIALDYLQKSGLVVATTSGALDIFAPLFTEFVRRQARSVENDDEIGIFIRDGIVYRDGLPLIEQPARLELRLLEYFCTHAGNKICTKAELEDYVWPYDIKEDLDDDPLSGRFTHNISGRLAQLVKRMRPKIEGGQKWDYIKTKHGIGYQFIQPPGHGKA